MRVFARYFSEDNFNFRRTTLIQLGNSWDLIGSAVLINPGSAAPITEEPIKGSKLSEICSFLGTGYTNDWYEFRPDPTMGWITKIFDGYYVKADSQKKLNGVIQLLNLFNLRNQHLGEALNSFQNMQSKHLFSLEEDVQLFRDKPVYLGWGSAGKSSGVELRDKASRIFDYVKKNNAYLHDEFDKNPFYHPRYLNVQHKRPRSKALLSNFVENTSIYTSDQFFGADGARCTSITKETLAEVIEVIGRSSRFTGNNSTLRLSEKGDKTVRIHFEGRGDDKLEFIITSSGGRYIGLRSASKAGGDWNNSLAFRRDYEQLLQKLKFSPPKNPWLGTKKIADIDLGKTDAESIVEAIFKELDSLIGGF
ncbi:hypothetical protein [Mangrovibacterium lignilyticum]|uniref:hypothetical protein n=1 Tax=Mangrovibacterium lignilyticum TaxID=2668052 RepID=UPI0013D5AD75|nr:hypothetical protein [Mangrovibacterium lignilyticum]